MDIYDIHSPRRSRRVKKATTFFGCVNKEKPKSVKSSQVTKGQSPVSTPAKSSTPSVHAQASRSSILYPTRTAGNGISAPLRFKNLTKKRQEWISDFKTKVAFTPAAFGIKSFKESRFLTLLTEELQTKIPDLTIEDVRHWAKLHSWITDEMQFKSLQKVALSTTTSAAKLETKETGTSTNTMRPYQNLAARPETSLSSSHVCQAPSAVPVPGISNASDKTLAEPPAPETSEATDQFPPAPAVPGIAGLTNQFAAVLQVHGTSGAKDQPEPMPPVPGTSGSTDQFADSPPMPGTSTATSSLPASSPEPRRPKATYRPQASPPVGRTSKAICPSQGFASAPGPFRWSRKSFSFIPVRRRETETTYSPTSSVSDTDNSQLTNSPNNSLSGIEFSFVKTIGVSTTHFVEQILKIDETDNRENYSRGRSGTLQTDFPAGSVERVNDSAAGTDTPSSEYGNSSNEVPPFLLIEGDISMVHSPNPDEINNSTPGYDADSTGNSYPIIQNHNLAEVMADSMSEEDEDGEHFESANNSDTNDTTNNVYQTIDDMINTNTYTTADDTFLNQRSATFPQSSQGSFLTPPYVDVWMSRGMEYQRVCRFGSILEINQLASGALHHSTTAELSPTLISFAGQLTVSAEAEMDNFIVPERSPHMPLNFKMEGR